MAEGRTVTFENKVSYANEFPKIWEFRPSERKELSHWSRHEFPLLQLIGKLDTDHWTKLKRKHKQFTGTSDIPSRPNSLSINELPKPRGGIQLNYYEQGKRRDQLLQESRTMYNTNPDAHTVKGTKKTTPKRPSIYNQHAKNGFKFWMSNDPHVNKISFCSKYTFGSKYTVHGLGNAPRN